MGYWVIEGVLTTWECILRVVLAGVCGALVGFERSRRQKEAGLRTHIIVAMGAALFMLVSKYSFADMPLMDTMRADGSRIASNVVTGVSFLGAGVIFVRGGSIRGLTTAAGIWTIAAVGLAMGGGLYIIGAMCTLLIFIVQIILHHWLPLSESMETHDIAVVLKSVDSVAVTKLLDYFADKKITVIETNIRRDVKNDLVKIDMSVRIQKDADLADAISLIGQVPEVMSVKM